MIAKGKYRARAIEHQFGIAGTGTDQIAVAFEILDEGEFQGHSITWFGALTKDAIDGTIKALRTCGWAGDDLASPDGLERNEVELDIVHDTYNGKTAAKVKWVNRIGGGIVFKHQMTAAQIAAIAAKYKAHTVATKPKDAASGAGEKYSEKWDQSGL
jgi:hypothetical protein